MSRKNKKESPNMAMRVARLTGTTPDSWLRVASGTDNELGIVERQRLKRIHRDGLAAVAARDFESAMLHVIHTLNLCEDQTIPWSLPTDAKERAEDLCRELTELFHDNIIPRVERLTRRDPGFQRFLGDLTP